MSWPAPWVQSDVRPESPIEKNLRRELARRESAADVDSDLAMAPTPGEEPLTSTVPCAEPTYDANMLADAPVPQPETRSTAAHPSADASELGCTLDISAEATLKHPRVLWTAPVALNTHDDWGCPRIPAFWYTLNLPFNYLHEIHRFEAATRACMDSFCKVTAPSSGKDVTREERRRQWVMDNADIVAVLHAVRVELLVRQVMIHIVPESELEPFLYWLRFEWGSNGNPHAHGLAFVAGNPYFEQVLRDEAQREELRSKGRRDVDLMEMWEQAEQK